MKLKFVQSYQFHLDCNVDSFPIALNNHHNDSDHSNKYSDFLLFQLE